MTQHILKRAKFSRPSGHWTDEDYDVLADGQAVGRIYKKGGVGTPRDMRWFWTITVIVPAVKNLTNGHAVTLQEAMATTTRLPQPEAAPEALAGPWDGPELF